MSWWREELPTTQEINNAFDFINGKKVDYVLTHEAPAHFVPFLLGHMDTRLPESEKCNSPLAKLFDQVYEICKFKHWYNICI